MKESTEAAEELGVDELAGALPPEVRVVQHLVLVQSEKEASVKGEKQGDGRE